MDSKYLNSRAKKCQTCSKEFEQKQHTVGRFCSYPCYWESLKVIEDPSIRFWLCVEKKEGCWIWIGNKHRDGYGQFSIRGKMTLAHRFSWMLHRGEIPLKMNILHSCDTRECVNPNHLFAGTQNDNVQDMIKKGRAWFS